MVLLLGASLLGSCGSLLGGGRRDDLFRFGVVERADAPSARYPVPRRTLTLLRSRFAPEIEGDRILTTRGERALYIKDARWVASVPDLFAQTLERQFETRAPGIRLAAPRNAAGASQALQVTVDRFEARYHGEGDQKAPPTVLVAGGMTLFDLDDRQPVASCRLSVEEPAMTNSTTGIVAAFNRAAVRYAASIADRSAQTSCTDSMDAKTRKGQNDER
ncbi:hypothetical protein NX02_09235 [Sphingomonas sanxanigenens DSM 19645 = NX02]|uniref:ABC-type transport auxiliary lipoprotein component domain-containing protein n=1 Tax=Sphingomonas sanxanigenens DSM 19645 = NX02 TaxID=1123269 RepID=W0AB88_9SPHN|nr:hypothetical protein NX02_09235 [Sphingomonas sanxanigenens DSM 19645 = NX02]